MFAAVTAARSVAGEVAIVGGVAAADVGAVCICVSGVAESGFGVEVLDMDV